MEQTKNSPFTKKQYKNMLAFSRASHIAGEFNVDPKYVQQLRKIIRKMGLNVGKVHEMINVLNQEGLL